MKEIKWSLWLLILRSENRNATLWSTQSGDILLSQLQTYWFNELLFFFNIIINLLLENRKQKIYYNWNVYWEARSDMPYTLTKGYATNYRLNNRISCRPMDTFLSRSFAPPSAGLLSIAWALSALHHFLAWSRSKRVLTDVKTLTSFPVQTKIPPKLHSRASKLMSKGTAHAGFLDSENFH